MGARYKSYGDTHVHTSLKLMQSNQKPNNTMYHNVFPNHPIVSGVVPYQQLMRLLYSSYSKCQQFKLHFAHQSMHTLMLHFLQIYLSFTTYTLAIYFILSFKFYMHYYSNIHTVNHSYSVILNLSRMGDNFLENLFTAIKMLERIGTFY